jgi:hypothetical protein
MMSFHSNNTTPASRDAEFQPIQSSNTLGHYWMFVSNRTMVLEAVRAEVLGSLPAVKQNSQQQGPPPLSFP